jgi:hypothetical protein
LNGRKHPVTGATDLQYSLRHIMGGCKDFQEEKTALQFLGTQLGVSVLLTPKFHTELAGEGVEYRAHSKSYTRRMPLSRKRGRENFKQLVRESACPVNVLPKERIEKFASRARAYICTYQHHLDQQQRKIQAALDAGSDQNTDNSTPSVVKQEFLFKGLKMSHGCCDCL